jgi:hypothetical protein
MHVSFALLLSVAVPAQAAPLPNLDLATGTLTHWEGEGFSCVKDPFVAVSSVDSAPGQRTRILHRTFVLPRDAGAVTFRAAAVRPDGVEAGGGALEVVLEGPERKLAPRLVRTDKGLVKAPVLLPLVKGQPRDYVWNVESLAGQTVRICAFDQDERPGCYVVCGGFTVWSRDDFNGKEFGDHMLRLCRENHLPAVTRFDSKRFLAVANADDVFVERQLLYCETLYDLFFEHFRKKRFTVQEPASRLMVAVFDSPAGFDAYVGRRMPNMVTGMYHTPTNRLVVYDYGQNRSFKEGSDKAREKMKTIPPTLQGRRVLGTFNREVREMRDDVNVGTVMHEVAHQLSFNCGLLNREGDVAAWLAEGLACYCEGTQNGMWLGVGGVNPLRVGQLAAQKRGDGPFIPLANLIGSDEWLRRGDPGTILVGYAQGWALFRLLMEERPAELKKYLTMVYPRRTPEHRLSDFVECFGNVEKFELHYREYIKELVRQEAKPAK